MTIPFGMRRMGGSAALGLVGFAVSFGGFGINASGETKPAANPARMARIGSIDERFQSYNVEMLEVTGGRFWAPYGAPKAAPDLEAAKLPTPTGMDPSLYRYRAPIDLSSPRLRRLAAALGPAYMRVSGTWANSTYFQDNTEPASKTPPEGFGGVLTRQEWKGVIDFSKATDAKIVTSFAITSGVRDANGVWTPLEAEKILAYTRQAGGSIAAAELFNEPTFAAMGGAPKAYDSAAYGRDFRVFRAYMKQSAPGLLILGPGSVGEAGGMGATSGPMKITPSVDILEASGPGVDGFSYHFYGGVSKRCATMGSALQITPEAALSDEWLSRTNRDETFYAGLRDRFEPGKPLWLTETGETACGGNPWASSFIDSFRYLNQLGTLAKQGVQVVMHNTLAASDYALIDEATLEPRPNYWSALLWRRLMGTTVLDAGTSPVADLHVYAHCLREVPGGVAMLVIDANRGAVRLLEIPAKSERYTLSSDELMGSKVNLNGRELTMGVGDSLPKLVGKTIGKGEVRFEPVSITFLAIPKAGNDVCR
jgi:heparanase 1